MQQWMQHEGWREAARDNQREPDAAFRSRVSARVERSLVEENALRQRCGGVFRATAGLTRTGGRPLA
jgi:hypothetical protein